MKPISIDTARSQGLTKFFTGDACVRGHVAERWAASNTCVVCQAENKHRWNVANREKNTIARKAWAEANPERHKAAKDAWNKAHPEMQAARSRAWFLANKEKANAATKAWQQANRDRSAASAKARAAANPERTKANAAAWRQANKATVCDYAAAYRFASKRAACPWADRDLIKDIYKLASVYREFGHDVHVDHEIPLRGKLVSGLHTHDNLQLLPSSINRSKSNHFDVR